MLKLVVMREGVVEGERPLTAERLRIGRDSQNDVVLKDPGKGVSRFHAEIRAEAGGYTVIDLNSRNGIWVGSTRVKTAALTLGTPVTLGAYQLAIREQLFNDTADTMSASGATTLGPDLGPPPQPVQPKRPAAKAPRPDQSRANGRYTLWIGSAIALLAVSIGALAILRHPTRKAPAPASPVVAAPSTLPIAPAPDHRQEMDRYLDEAKAQIARKDYDGALSSLSSALELEPTDPDARALKERVEAANAARVTTPPPKPLPPQEPVMARPPGKPPTPVEAPLVAGISRAPGESPADYGARAKRVQDNYGHGKTSLEKRDYQAALDSLSAVQREQPGYQDAEALLAQTRTEMHETAREAMDNASKNEAAGEWYAALQWYQHAERFESTPELAQKMRVVQERLTKDAYSAFDKANALRKLNQTAKAILEYQKVRDWLPPDDEKRKEALKQLQVLRP